MTKELKSRVSAQIDALRDDMIIWSTFIHDHPELGHKEFKACELLTSQLKRHGFAVEKGIAGLPTAFRATFHGGGDGPAVAFLAEYDALPDLGHACGHNLIGTASVGAGIALSKIIGDLKGSVVVLGTPAEETSGGKVTMVGEGVFKDIGAAMMVHPGAYNSTRMNSLAIDPLEFVFKGKPAHAAAAPHEGINALDACIGLFNAVNALRQHLKPEARVHGIITEGGVAPNIVPERAVARFYVRAPGRSYLNEVVEKVKNCARGAALAAGAEVAISHFEFSNDNMRTNMALAEAFEKNLRSLGVKEIESPGPGLGSTDIGNVSHVVPAIHASLAIGPRTLVGHTPEFARSAVSTEGHRALILAAKALAMTAVDVFARPELVKQMKEEFERDGRT